MNAGTTLVLLYEERTGLADDEEGAGDEDNVAVVGLAKQIKGFPHAMSQSSAGSWNILRWHGAGVGGRRHNDPMR